MKRHLHNPFLLPVLMISLGLMLAHPVTAQTFTTLHGFTNAPDGATPVGGLVLSGNTLYGTTTGGGTAFNGTIFAVNIDGTGYTNFYRFQGGNDGYDPRGGLTLAAGTLYGTTESGGTNGNGTIFSIGTNGTGFVPLYSFSAYYNVFPNVNSDGANPYASLFLSGGTLYGTAYAGGTNADGTVFAINTDGTGFTNIYNFTGGGGAVPHDGAAPAGGVILLGNTLYGTTYGGGTGAGIVFSVETNGTGIDPLHVFASPPADGQLPFAGLTSSGNTLYGTTFEGGNSSDGIVFAVNVSGSGYTNLYNFTATNPQTGTNTDGSGPSAGLILSSNTLYGTAKYGGNYERGTVFAVSTNGTGFTNLYSFTGGSDGAYPESVLVLSGTTLYGTTTGGGIGGHGTVFSLSLVPVTPRPPPLAIVPSGNNFIIAWPTNATGIALQSVTSLSSGSWSNVTSGIEIAGPNYVFTNTVDGSAAFFRLNQP